MSRKEAVLDALLALLAAALPAAEVARNAVRPTALPPGGLVILRDGDRGEPEVTLGVESYAWEHRAEIEVFANKPTPNVGDKAFDAMLEAMDAALRADVTLGGAVDHAELLTEETEDQALEGAADVKAGTVFVLLVYITTANFSN